VGGVSSFCESKPMTRFGVVRRVTAYFSINTYKQKFLQRTKCARMEKLLNKIHGILRQKQ
jgi:hypothetical protein